MISFVWPWVFFLLPLPWLARRFLPPVEPLQGAALRVPFLQDFTQRYSTPHFGQRSWLLAVAILSWLMLIAAASRPQWVGEAIALPVSGRDLMLAVDLSESMSETDFQIQGQTVDRLTAAQWVAQDFIARREGDRIGLVLFGAQAYLQTPLTFDRATVLTMLGEAQIGLAGRATAIGDAIGLAIKRQRENSDTSRVLILMTDGANTAGEVDPLQAADLAAREGLTIYTIGIGADEMLIRGLLGTRRVNPSADLDEETLQAIADKTGGQYFRARDTDALASIYRLLDELEPVERDPKMFRPTMALYFWPLAGALFFGSILIGVQIKGRAG